MFGNLLNLESNLWDEFQRMQWEMDNLFNRSWGRSNIRSVTGATFPAINVGATSEAVHVFAFAPGVDPKTLEVSLEGNLLTISGERKREPRETSDRAGYYLHERFEGKFRRVVSLPETVNPDQVNASYHDGILNVTVAKQEEAKPRQIKVNV